ncbi:hypothetical protein [Streptomyces sp. SID14478]|nr:hypothetical protein [Streptomyces sp. SID14478]
MGGSGRDELPSTADHALTVAPMLRDYVGVTGAPLGSGSLR